MGVEHGGQGGGLQAGDVAQETIRRQVRGQTAGHLGGVVDGHAQQGQGDALAQGGRLGPVPGIQDADLIAGFREPALEIAAHGARAAHDGRG